jgi:hypothetical protein
MLLREFFVQILRFFPNLQYCILIHMNTNADLVLEHTDVTADRCSLKVLNYLGHVNLAGAQINCMNVTSQIRVESSATLHNIINKDHYSCNKLNTPHFHPFLNFPPQNPLPSVDFDTGTDEKHHPLKEPRSPGDRDGQFVWLLNQQLPRAFLARWQPGCCWMFRAVLSTSHHDTAQLNYLFDRISDSKIHQPLISTYSHVSGVP